MGVKLAALLALPGCSFAAMRTDPMAQLAAVPKIDPDCDATVVAPVADTVLSIGELAFAYYETVALFRAIDREPGGAPGAAMVGLLGVAIVGAATAGSALHGFIGAHACREAHIAFAAGRETARRREEREARRERAWRIAKDAEIAARRGDCALVTQLDQEIAALDLDLHDSVFVRDVAVARCLR